MWLWNVCKNLLKLGIKNSDATSLQTQLVFLNFGALIWVFPLLLSAIFFITTDYWHYGLLMFMSIAFLSLVPILNSFRQFQLSTFLFYICVHFNLFMSNVIAEFHFETYLLLIPFLVHLYFLTDSLQKLTLHYTVILVVYGFPFVLVRYFPHTQLTKIENNYYITGNYFFTLTLFLAFMLIGAFLRSKKVKLVELRFAHVEEKHTKLLTEYQAQQSILRGVKNRSQQSISLLANMLTLQRLGIEDDRAKQRLVAASKRLKAISSIQSKVYDYPDFLNVPLHEVFQDALDLVLVEEGAKMPEIVVDLAVDPAYVTAEKAVGIGVLSYELLHNVYKHAFPNKVGRIEIQLIAIRETKYIRIQDNGIGYDPLEIEENIGFTVLGNYAKQLNIQFEIEHEGGTKITLVFQ
jgi:two-component sensor histidine kinase